MYLVDELDEQVCIVKKNGKITFSYYFCGKLWSMELRIVKELGLKTMW